MVCHSYEYITQTLCWFDEINGHFGKVHVERNCARAP